MPRKQNLQMQLQQEWAKKIEKWNISGQTISDWCKKNKISRSVFYQWRKRLHHLTCQPRKDLATSDFVEIPEEPSFNPEIEIIYQNMTIRVKQGFDSKTLRSCLQILREL